MTDIELGVIRMLGEFERGDMLAGEMAKEIIAFVIGAAIDSSVVGFDAAAEEFADSMVSGGIDLAEGPVLAALEKLKEG